MAVVLERWLVVFFAQLVAQREPSRSQIVVAGEQLDLVSRWHQQIDDGVYLLGLLTLLPNLGNYQVVRYFGVELDVLITRAFITNQARLGGVQEVKAVGNVNLAVFRLDPGELVHDLVAPLVHALIPNVHLRVEHPQKAEALAGQHFHGNVYDFLVAHGAVAQVELVVGEHVAAVISLCSLDPPWRIDVHYLKMADLFHEVLQVEKPKVAVYISFGPQWLDLIFVIVFAATFVLLLLLTFPLILD